jgi:DNA-directed RNA polymerase alpha subunit
MVKAGAFSSASHPPMGRDQGLDAWGEGEEMSDEKKDLAEARAEKEAQKPFRKLDAAQALNDHEKSQKAFFENRDRLRAERLAREAAVVPMHDPIPELPDDTPLQNVLFSTRIRNGLTAGGFKTVGDVRQESDASLLSIPDLG